VHEQQDGIRAVLAANREPLLDAADGREEGFVDALRGVDRGGAGDLVMAQSAVGEAGSGAREHEREDGEQDGFRDSQEFAEHARALLRGSYAD